MIEERKRRSREKICPALKMELAKLRKKKRECSRGRNNKHVSGNSDQRTLL